MFLNGTRKADYLRKEQARKASNKKSRILLVFIRPNEFAINRSSIKRGRQEHRQQAGTKIHGDVLNRNIE